MLTLQAQPRHHRPVRRKTLRLLLRIWAGENSGTLHLDEGQIRFHLGEPCTPEDLRKSLRALDAVDASPPRFARRNASGPPPVPVMARAMWKAGLRCSRPLEASSGRLTPTPAARRLAAFPVSPRTRRFLEGDLDLAGLIRLNTADRNAVRQELAVLVAVGVYKVPKAPAATRQDPQGLARLQREANRLKGADCWTVLGTRDMSQLDRAADRLERRYTPLLKDADPKVRELARGLLDQVRQAAGEARTGRVSAHASLDHHNALDVGRAEIEQGNFTNAVKAFAVLKQAQPFNGQALAWLGYALMHDPTFPEARRASRGRRFLEQAESMGGHRGDADVLLARLDIAEGDLVRAWTRLDKTVKLHPSNVLARELLAQVRREVRS